MLLVKLVVTTFTNVEKVYLNAKEKQAIRTEKWRKMMGEREREEKKIKERKEIRKERGNSPGVIHQKDKYVEFYFIKIFYFVWSIAK